MDGLINRYEGQVAIRKYNVAESEAGMALADEYDVQFVPTFVLVDSRGETAEVIIGAVSEEDLRQALDALD